MLASRLEPRVSHLSTTLIRFRLVLVSRLAKGIASTLLDTIGASTHVTLASFSIRHATRSIIESVSYEIELQPNLKGPPTILPAVSQPQPV